MSENERSLFGSDEPDETSERKAETESAGPREVVDRKGQALLGGMFSDDELEQIDAEQIFQRVGLDLPTDYRCPRCTYEWSGNPKPKTADLAADLES